MSDEAPGAEDVPGSPEVLPTNGESAQEIPVVPATLAGDGRSVVPQRRVRRPAPLPMSPHERRRLGLMLLMLPLLLITQIVALWPSALAATLEGRGQPVTVWLFGVERMTLSPDGSLLLLAALVGALASLAEVSFRFATNAGRDELSSRWTWSYVLRPMQGAVLAVAAYFTLRAGLVGSSSTGPLNPYGIASLAALVGLFTRQAFQKLKGVFNSLWGVDDLDADIEPDPHAEPSSRPTRRRH
jgi:hypothetical protein